jgi:hypothetical protein
LANIEAEILSGATLYRTGKELTEEMYEAKK